MLVIIYDEAMIREVCHECVIGIRVSGKTVNMIRHAGDKTVVADSQEGLQELLEAFEMWTWRRMLKIS